MESSTHEGVTAAPLTTSTPGTGVPPTWGMGAAPWGVILTRGSGGPLWGTTTGKGLYNVDVLINYYY